MIETCSIRRVVYALNPVYLVLTALLAATSVAAGAQTANPQPSPAAVAIPTGMAAPDAKEEADRLAIIKESQNPVGNIAIVPFQSNWNYGGKYDRLQYNLNIQPVIPFEITPKLNLISRTIIPIVDQPSALGPRACVSPAGCPWTFGIGDTQEQLYFARTRPGSVIWGAGPIFYLPTQSPAGLGATKTSAGPTAVALIMPGNYVMGILANQAWSVIGPKTDPAVSTFFVEPFINDNLGKGWAVVSAPQLTANWNAPGDNKWVVPTGFGVLKTFKIGEQLQQIQVPYYANVVRPVGTPYGQYRFQCNILYPVKRR